MHDMYISNSLLVFVKFLTILSVLTISRFYDNYTPRSGVGGLGQNIILCQHISAITVCYCSKNVHITVNMTIVFMTTSGIFTVRYDRILPICLYDICGSDICRLAGSLLFYSIDDLILNYVIYNCLLRMIYVIWLAIHSKLCRGAYTVVLLIPLYLIIHNVHIPD